MLLSDGATCHKQTAHSGLAYGGPGFKYPCVCRSEQGGRWDKPPYSLLCPLCDAVRISELDGSDKRRERRSGSYGYKESEKQSKNERKKEGWRIDSANVG